jgi:predicted amidohydrolase
MKENADFFNLYNHGFIRVAVGTPELRVADPAFNGARTIELMEQAEREKAVLALFPELGLTSYSCEDLFHQQALLDSALEALRGVLQASEALNLIAVVGMPLQVDHLLFNCAIVIHRGKILGIVPKTFLPNIVSSTSTGSSLPPPRHAVLPSTCSARTIFLSGSDFSLSVKTNTGLPSLWRSARISGCLFRRPPPLL